MVDAIPDAPCRCSAPELGGRIAQSFVKAILFSDDSLMPPS